MKDNINFGTHFRLDFIDLGPQNRVLGGSLGGPGEVWGGLGEIFGALGPENRPENGPGHRCRQEEGSWQDFDLILSGVWGQHGRIWGPKAEPKSAKIDSKMDRKINPFMDHLFDRFWVAKMIKKRSQN